MTTLPHSWPCRQSRHTFEVEEERDEDSQAHTMSRLLICVCDGVAVALHSLLSTTHPVGALVHVPAIWDERVVPLCDVGAPVASFLWVGLLPASVVPTLHDVSELVCTIVDRLHMRAADLVLVMALLEELLVKHDATIMQLYSARPILLAACIVARKLACDNGVSTPQCVRVVTTYFTGLTTLQCARIERQLLEYLDWRIPIDAHVYERHTHALLRNGTPSDTLPLPLTDVPWLD